MGTVVGSVVGSVVASVAASAAAFSAAAIFSAAGAWSFWVFLPPQPHSSRARTRIKEIILCEENRKNIEEIQPMYLTGLTFHYVKDIKEVLQLALTDEKVNGAIDFCNANQKSDEKK